MGKGYLIDTNAILDYTSGAYPDKGLDFMDDVVNDGINISIINKIEALSFVPKNNNQIKYFKLVVDFMEEANIFDLTDDVVNQTIQLRKTYKTKLPDAIIAATVLVNGLSLITRNTKDFKNIKELNIINPYKYI